jgi:ribosomal protein S18 acetylase RimI-like enzyme
VNALVIREAVAEDAERIAELHARSWQSAYRGILPDDFLDHEVHADRRQVWRERMVGKQFVVILAEQDGVARGFAAFAPHPDPRWGTLLDNLHVEPESKGQGIGYTLFRAGVQRMLTERPGLGVNVTVYVANAPAVAFYERIGGQRIDVSDHAPGAAPGKLAYRYYWPPEQLRELA